MKKWRRAKQEKQTLRMKSIRELRDRYSSKLDESTAWSDMMLPESNGQSVTAASGRSPFLLLFVTGAVVGLAVILVVKLFTLQVTSHERFLDLANGNRIRETISYAPRGNIYDRHGELIASNTITFQLSATPYLTAKTEAERQADYRQIAGLLGIKDQAIKDKVEAHGLDYPLPVIVKQNIKHSRALALMQYLSRLQGFHLSEVPTRQYVADAGLAHILGYTGIVSDQDLDAGGDKLLPIDIVGKTGIEKQYDEVLRGHNGLERTEVDTLGHPVRVLARRPAQAGQDITLTIDLKVQRRLAKEMKQQMKQANVTRGSGVALDPASGEVIAMVSLPYYDNNLFANGISEADFNRLANNPDEPLTNKVTAGGFTTGSTIKPMVASAALQENVVTPETIIVDTGAIAVTSVYQPGAQFIFRGWRPGGLGPMNVRSAIAWSSNIYFYTVGGGYGNIGGLGVDRLTHYYRQFGLGEASDIDLPGEISGRVPDRQWKREFKNEQWYVGDTYNISIGQGDLVVSPLQLTLGDMAVANNGYVLRPQLLKRIGDREVAKRQVRREVPVSKQNLQIVREGMRQVLTNGTTCECTFTNVPHKVAGKSGTAQTTSDESRRPHAWFTAFAPFENPQIMVTVMLEEGSGGSQFAAPAIAGAMETYFKNQ